MAVYLYTFHTYRSWSPDHRRGFVQRKQGILPPDAAMAAAYSRRARFERFTLDEPARRVALDAVRQTCAAASRSDWELHLAVAVFNHLHVLVSWRHFTDADRVKAVLHRAITVHLRDAFGLPAGRPVLSRGGSRKRITTPKHYNHLKHTYLPSHRKYGGVILMPPNRSAS